MRWCRLTLNRVRWVGMGYGEVGWNMKEWAK